jgi:hypothetical protein
MKRLSRGVALLAVGVLLPLSAGGDDKASEKGPEAGWVSLFDGQTLSGWEMLELRGSEGKSKWEVKDGALCGSGGQSMLFSPKGDYKNFRFRAEIKINDRGNSGMYFRTAKKPSFTDGYEAQVNSTHGDPIKTGSIYTMVHIYKQLVPPDTWFTQEVECVDRDYRGKMVAAIRVKVNDELLYEFLDHDRTFTSGHFAFQQHDPGSRVCIRKVEVMELPETKAK